MAYLTVYTDSDRPERLIATQAADEIRAALAPIGVDYDRWEPVEGLAPDASADVVLAAYADSIAQLTEAEGYALVDIVALHPSDEPGWVEVAAGARQKFLAEHTHGEDEVRFFAGGSGIFYLHVDHKVYAVLGERGDLLSVPHGTTHWFDMGTRPDFTAIRFFKGADGWIGDFTGDPISDRIPDFDTIVAGRQVTSG